MNKKKKNRGNWLYMITTIAYILLFIWVFMLPGTKGLVIWDPGYAMYFYILGFIGFIPIILWLLDRFVLKKKGHKIVAKLLSFILLLVPIGITAFFFIGTQVKAVDLPPVVFINDHSQAERYTLTYWTKEKQSDTLEVIMHKSEAVEAIQLKDDGLTNQHAFSFGQPEVASYDLTTEQGQFTWSVDQSSAIKRFAIASDSHIGTAKSSLKNTKTIMQSIYNETYDCFFLLGDIVEYGFDFQQWEQAIQILASQERVVPIKPLIGNHDILFRGEHLFDQLMGDDYFRVDFGGIHFIGLNLPWGIEDFSVKQKQWLQTQLESIPKQDWTVVLTHAFLYASGYNYRGVLWADNTKAIDELVPMFESYGVDMVFSGHNHQMEHLSTNGIDYFIAGAFGCHLDPEREFTSEGSIWYDNQHHGYVDLTIGATTATVTFLDVDNQHLYTHVVEK
ncbi:MAG TPA: metallophosphoesterase [Thermotogota bacterium]|nr:metallophosphoesterase [Thermotogota bacterium]